MSCFRQYLQECVVGGSILQEQNVEQFLSLLMGDPRCLDLILLSRIDNLLAVQISDHVAWVESIAESCPVTLDISLVLFQRFRSILF